MAKANLTLSNGTEVDIEGTPEEIQALLTFYDSSKPKAAAKEPPAAKSNAIKEKRDGGGARARIRELLLEEGFFTNPRSLKATQDKLAEHGHIYPQNTLSARLIDMTKAKELRRFKDQDVWVYVNR